MPSIFVFDVGDVRMKPTLLIIVGGRQAFFSFQTFLATLVLRQIVVRLVVEIVTGIVIVPNPRSVIR